MSSFKMFPAIGAAYMDYLIFFEWDLKDAFQMTRRDDYPEGKELPPQFAFPPREFQQKDEVTGERMVCKSASSSRSYRARSTRSRSSSRTR